MPLQKRHNIDARWHEAIHDAACHRIIASLMLSSRALDMQLRILGNDEHEAQIQSDQQDVHTFAKSKVAAVRPLAQHDF